MFSHQFPVDLLVLGQHLVVFLVILGTAGKAFFVSQPMFLDIWVSCQEIPNSLVVAILVL